MTIREFYTQIANGVINDEVIAEAASLLEKMDAVNARKRELTAKKSLEKEAERAPLRQKIFEMLGSTPKTAATLIAESGLDIKPQAIIHLMKPFLEDGSVIKEDVKVTGKGTQKGYRLA